MFWLIYLFDLILYVPVNNLSVMMGQVFLGGNSTKLELMCLAQGHSAVTPVRLKPAALQSGVKYSTTALPYVLVKKLIFTFTRGQV